jgi:hypothetical protein
MIRGSQKSNFNFEQKYLKYKQKYVRLSQSGGNYMINNQHISEQNALSILGIIELYNKTLNLYQICRFRNNNNSLISESTFSDLHNIIQMLLQNGTIHAYFNTAYITDFQMNEIDRLEHVLFTLRQITTKYIKGLLMPLGGAQECIAMIGKIETYKEFFLKDVTDQLTQEYIKKAFDELIAKCKELGGLVTPSITPFEKKEGIKGLEIIRSDTNNIINIIGNNVSYYSANYTMQQSDIQELNRLFIACFTNITRELLNLQVISVMS